MMVRTHTPASSLKKAVVYHSLFWEAGLQAPWLLACKVARDYRRGILTRQYDRMMTP